MAWKVLGKSAATSYSWREGSSALTMKVIPLSKAKAKLSYYSRLCQREPIIVTVKGVPAFQMVPLKEDDDLIDRLLEHNPDFRDYLEKCLRSASVPAKEALDRLK
jgi:hypothetical protein